MAQTSLHVRRNWKPVEELFLLSRSSLVASPASWSSANAEEYKNNRKTSSDFLSTHSSHTYAHTLLFSHLFTWKRNNYVTPNDLERKTRHARAWALCMSRGQSRAPSDCEARFIGKDSTIFRIIACLLLFVRRGEVAWRGPRGRDGRLGSRN